MRILYHLWLSPDCRAVRVAMSEKGLEFSMQVERIWNRRHEFLSINPAGEVPVLVDEDESALCGVLAILEYLDEAYPERPLIGANMLERAETRRLVDWFGRKFKGEVTDNLVHEKVMKRFLGLGAPDSNAIRAGRHNIGYHLDYIGYLSERRNWLAGRDFSLADIMAGAHLSCVDYLGDVPWSDHPPAKDWYMRLKSRPSFRPLLADRIPGMSPPDYYDDLDF